MNNFFPKAYDETMTNEGGWVNDKTDRGGETYCGISRKFHPAWLGWRVIDQHKHRPNFPACLKAVPELNELKRIFYKQHFWDVNRLDEINNALIVTELFDTGVNMGPEVAARFLQRALNVLNKNGYDYPDLDVDGQIGPKTLALVNKHKAQIKILQTLKILQGAKYIGIMENDLSQEKYANGWLERV